MAIPNILSGRRFSVSRSVMAKASWRNVVLACILSSLFGCGTSPAPTVAELLMDADEKQFSEIFPKFAKQAEQGLPILVGEINRKLPPDATNEAKVTLAKHQASSAVAFLNLDQPAKVWRLLKYSPDLMLWSFMIDPFRARHFQTA